MSSRASRPRPTSTRSRRQRLAAGAVLATTGLLGTYLAAIRPQPTYASPNVGNSATQGRSLLQPNDFRGCSSVPAGLARTDVYDDTTLRAAVLTADDTTFICITQSITLSAELSIDDTTLTIAGDDSTVTVNLGGTSRFLDVNFTGDDTLTLQGLTIANGFSGNDDGGAIKLFGSGVGALVVSYMSFIDNKNGPYAQNIEQEGGAIFARDIARVVIDNSRFEGNYSVYEGGAN